jgi:hypothetical protein
VPAFQQDARATPPRDQPTNGAPFASNASARGDM